MAHEEAARRADLIDDPRCALPPKTDTYNTIESMIRHFKHIVDGVRMVTNHMLDLPEWQMTHDHLVSARDVSGAASTLKGACASKYFKNAVEDQIMAARPLKKS